MKNSPSGMLCSPSQGMKWRPATPSVRSVPSATIRTCSRPSIHSARRWHSSEAASRLRADPGRRRGRRGSRSPRSRRGSSRRRRRGRWSGYIVPTQRCSPSEARCIIVCISSRVAARRAVWRSGSTLESSRVFVSAQIAIRQSASSAAQRDTGEIHSSCASEACLK